MMRKLCRSKVGIIGIAVILFAMVFMFMWGVANATPNLVCDPYPTTVVQPDKFYVTMDSAAAVSSPAQLLSDGSKRLYYDVGGVTAGTHQVKIKACKTDAAFGEVCSSEVSFTFTRPSAPIVPSGIGLAP